MASDKVRAQTVLLFNCVHHGHSSVLKKLLKSGANPNVCDGQGEPLIFIPIVDGNYDMLEILLSDERCDVNIQSHDARTPLITAVEMDDMEMIKTLLKSGAYVDSVDGSGKTPLLLALEEGKFKIAEYLIKHGSDVNVVDGLEQSALFLVASSGRSDCINIVKKLLKCGYQLDKDISWISPEELNVDQLSSGNKLSKLMKKFTSKIIALPGVQQSLINKTQT